LIQHGRPLLSCTRADACNLAIFVYSIESARLLGQLVEDGSQSINQVSNRTSNLLNQPGGVYVPGCIRNGKISQKWQVKMQEFGKEGFAYQMH
jgi:hypothetical protein